MPEQNVTPAVVSPNVGVGFSSKFGVIFAVVAGLGMVWAGIEGQDSEAIVAGIAATLAAVTTVGGRMAQAVAVIRSSAEAAAPYIDAVQEGILPPDEFDEEQVNGVSQHDQPVVPPALR